MHATARPILFVGSSGNGMFNPMLVLAGELARRGVPDLWFAADAHRCGEIDGIPSGPPVSGLTSSAVSSATSEGAAQEGRHRVQAHSPASGASQSSTVRSTVTFASLGDEIPELSPTSWDDATYRRITQRSTRKAMHAAALHTLEPSLRLDKYERLDAIVRKIKPALMIVDTISAFAARLAIAHGIPYVLAAPFMPSNVLFPKVPKGFPVPNSGLGLQMTRAQRMTNRLFPLRVLGLLRHPRIVRALTRFVQARKRLGIPPHTGKRTAVADNASLILCHTAPGVDYPIPLPPKLRVLGAMIPPLPEAPGADLLRWLGKHESIVYIGLGTITRLTAHQVATLVDVVRKLDDHQVLWKLPRAQQALLPADLPPNLRIESWLPSQLDVLAHPNVKVFVNHAGGGSFHEGLYFGKPMVLYPLWVDCHDQAVRGEDAGVSRTLNDPLELDDAVHKIRQVLTDDSFRTRAEHFRQSQLEAGGREAAADAILALDLERLATA